MSRFVPAGTDLVDDPTSDAWAKAREEVSSIRTSKPIEKGKQEDGKSLYEVLQANKAAKQEAFEEAAKLRNQFRALDDSEVRFLESIQESERAKEDAARQETAAQLEQFRMQRLATEQAALKESQTQGATVHTQDATSVGAWTASKKRRRLENTEAVNSGPKLRKTSLHSGDHQVPENSIPKPKNNQPKDAGEVLPIPVRKQETPRISASAPKPNNVGLVTYSSDDDDD